MADFSTAQVYTATNEGGLTPDGLTNYGITAAEAATMGYNGPIADVPYSVAVSYLQQNYWIPLNLDSVVAQGPATGIYDMAVLAGHGGAGQMTQQVLADLGISVTMDGLIGPETLAGVNQADPNAFVADLSTVANAYLQALPNAGTNPGWVDRAERLQTLQTGIAGAVAEVTTNPKTSALIAAAIIAGILLLVSRRKKK